MKKFLFLSSAVALSLASCSDDFAPVNNTTPLEGKAKAYVNLPVGDLASETRTVLNGKSVVFENGDVIGLYNADANGGIVTNAPFAYSTSQDPAEFVGQIYLEPEQEYYAYYPYNQNQTFSSDSQSFTMQINPSQSFNAVACQGIPVADYNDWSSTTYQGSFSNMTVPAIATATSDAEGESITFTLQGLSSFIVVPVTGLTGENAIKQVTLSINGVSEGAQDATPQVIAGSFTVDPATWGTESNTTYKVEKFESDENDGTVITLNCGRGLNLSLDKITNLWFVVPAGVPVSSLTLTFVDGQEPKEGVNQFTRPYTNAWSTRLNTPAICGVAKNTPFKYSGGKAIITTVAQFLEYANLVTLGVDVVEPLYEEMLKGDNADQAAFSSLPSMLSELSSTASVNDAIIADDLEFDVEVISTLIGKGNGIIGSSATLDPYFAYLQNYVDSEGKIKPIGGSAQFVMSGLNKAAADAETPDYVNIDGLNIDGDGMFVTGNLTSNANISNLEFVNVTVYPSSTTTPPYFFYQNAWNSTYNKINDVVVDSTCGFSPANEDGTLFNATSTQAIQNGYISNIQSEMPYAVTLTVNTPDFSFDSEASMGVEAFKTVAVIANGKNSVLYIESPEDAETLLARTYNNGTLTAQCTKFAYNGNPFSIVYKPKTGNAVSYWTGTSSSTALKGSAEQLAAIVQGTEAAEFEMTMDLDLMDTPWWATNSELVTVIGTNGENDPFSISSILINGNLADNKTRANGTLYTLLGAQSAVTDLIITDITINGQNKAPKDSRVGALSSYVGGVTTGVKIESMNVEGFAGTGLFNGVVGGLYANITTLEYNEADSYSNSSEDAGSLTYGQLAGSYSIKANKNTGTTPAVVTIPSAEAFGKIMVSVEPAESGATYIVVKGVTTLSDIPNFGFTASGTFSNGYPINVYLEGNTTTPYQWFYNTTTGEFNGGKQSQNVVPLPTGK